jgi:DNA polymerase-3 subunit gamma/tau
MLANVTSFEDVVALAGRKRDGLLRVHLEENVSLVRFDAATGSIDLHLLADAPASLPNDLREKLNRWTGGKWIVMLSKAAGAPTLGSIRREREAKERAILEQHPAIQAVLDTFPGAKIAAIRKQTVTPRDDDATGTG